MIEYVFYRFYDQQIRVVKERKKAALYAILYMSIGPQLIVLTADMMYSYIVDTRALVDILGSIVFLGGTYAIVFLWHWWALVKGGKAEKIRRYYAKSHPYNIRSTVYAHAYFYLPALCGIAVSQYIALQR